jgi:hypothetical protein
MNGRDLTLTRDGANPIGTISSADSAIVTSPLSTFTSSWVVRERAHVEAHGSVKAKIPKEVGEKNKLGCQDFPADGAEHQFNPITRVTAKLFGEQSPFYRSRQPLLSS